MVGLKPTWMTIPSITPLMDYLVACSSGVWATAEVSRSKPLLALQWCGVKLNIFTAKCMSMMIMAMRMRTITTMRSMLKVIIMITTSTLIMTMITTTMTITITPVGAFHGRMITTITMTMMIITTIMLRMIIMSTQGTPTRTMDMVTLS